MSRWQLLTIFFAISGLGKPSSSSSPHGLGRLLIVYNEGVRFVASFSVATTQMAVQGGLLSLPEEVMEEEWFITIIRPPVVSAFFSICGVNTLVSIQALLCCSGQYPAVACISSH